MEQSRHGAAHENQADEAIRNFQQSLQLRPTYTIALLNLGNFYRRQGNFGEAELIMKTFKEIRAREGNEKQR